MQFMYVTTALSIAKVLANFLARYQMVKIFGFVTNAYLCYCVKASIHHAFLKNEHDCFPVKPFINPGGSLDLVCTHSFLAPDLEYVKSSYKSRGKMEKAKDFRGYPDGH